MRQHDPRCNHGTWTATAATDLINSANGSGETGELPLLVSPRMPLSSLGAPKLGDVMSPHPSASMKS